MNGTTLLRASALAFGLATLPACSDDEPSNDGDGVAVDGGGGGGGGGGGETQGTVSSCDLKADVGYCLDFTPDAPPASRASTATAPRPRSNSRAS